MKKSVTLKKTYMEVLEENEIQFIKRTTNNNTHKVIEDDKILKITSWRKSKSKFLKSLFFNIITFGILHLLSLYNPNLYIKMYCLPCNIPKECDYFLVEDIYHFFSLCKKILKKNTHISNNNFTKGSNNKRTLIDFGTKTEYYYLLKHLTYSFEYNSVTYEYDEETNKIMPIYMDLSKMTNKGIYNFFIEGLSSEIMVNKFQSRYGLNEYKMNHDLAGVYSKKIEGPVTILILLTSIIEYVFGDKISFFTMAILLIIKLVWELIMFYILIISKYKNDHNTIDGDKTKIRVRRKHLIKNDLEYAEINNFELLPGDIIYLTDDDIVPCDCLLLEGECIANESNLTGSLDIHKKENLEINTNNFDYNLNKTNIIFHGMKINKIFTKIKSNYITALCINTGPNTYKANQYSNLFYFTERKKSYKEMYELFGEERKNLGIVIIIICIITALIILTLYFFFPSIKKLNLSITDVIIIILRMVCKNYMPTFFLVRSLIVLTASNRLKEEKVHCLERSRLFHAAKINTIIFSKTGTLCHNKFEITGYHPVFIDHNIENKVCLDFYKNNESNKMNLKLIDYYKEYVENKYKNPENSEKNLKALKLKKFSDKNIAKLLKDKTKNCHLNSRINGDNNENVVLFMECLLSCNNIEQFNTELLGNIIEAEYFRSLKWEITTFDYKEKNINNDDIDSNNGNEKKFNENKNYYNKFYYDSEGFFVDNRISDIFPKNYFKITRLFKNHNLNNNNNYMLNLEIPNEELEIKPCLLRTSTNIINSILEDNSSQQIINSYKLRIYKRFINIGTLSSSAIVFNFLTKKLRFMTKGVPEEIISKCKKGTYPENIEEIIKKHRIKGYIVEVCATKLIDINTFDDKNENLFYMNNLNFCGLFTLKYKLKKEAKNTITELNNFKCKMAITTGDDVYNALGVGYDCGIIEDKKIYSFDLDTNKNQIIITNVNNINFHKYFKNKENIFNGSPYISNKITQNQYSPNINSKNTSMMKRSISINSKTSSSLNNINLSNTNSNIFQNSNNNFNNITPKNEKKENKNFTNFLEDEISSEEDESEDLQEINRVKSFTTLHRNKVVNKLQQIKQKLSRRDGLKRTPNIPNIVNKIQDNSNVNMPSLNITNKNLSKNSFNNSDFSDGRNRSRENTVTPRQKVEGKNISKNNNSDIIFKQNNKIPYSPEILKYLRRNSIFCISGKAFSFLYERKNEFFYKKLLLHIEKLCKVYFKMHALDKSRVIDFYRDFSENKVCMIGETQSDFDSIISAHVGINIRAPKNRNTILCHFYSVDRDISSILKIMLHGRVTYENVFLLKYSTVVYTLIIDTYMITCYIHTGEIIENHVNVVVITYIILTLLAFTNKGETNIKPNDLIQNGKLFTKYNMIQVIGLIIIKLITSQSFAMKFRRNSDLDPKVIEKSFCTYFFVLSYSQLFSTLLAYNNLQFYRKTFYLNTFYVFAMLFATMYFISSLTLNDILHKFDPFSTLYFGETSKNTDTFNDKLKLTLFYAAAGDCFSSVVYAKVLYYIFMKLAKKKPIKVINKKNGI